MFYNTDSETMKGKRIQYTKAKYVVAAVSNHPQYGPSLQISAGLEKPRQEGVPPAVSIVLTIEDIKALAPALEQVMALSVPGLREAVEELMGNAQFAKAQPVGQA